MQSNTLCWRHILTTQGIFFAKSQQAIAFEKKKTAYFLVSEFEPFSESFLPE